MMSNSASRILDILKSLLKQKDGTKIIQAWKNVFDTKNNQEVFTALAQCLEESDSLKLQILSLDTIPWDISLLFEQHSKLQKIFAHSNLMQDIKVLKDHITTELKKELRLCSSILESSQYIEYLNENKIEPDVLADLRQKAESIYNSLKEERNINPELKHILLSCINSIIYSIIHYQANGIKEIKKAIHFAMGESINNIDLIEEEKKNVTVQKCFFFIKETFGVVNNVAKIASWFGYLPSELQNILQLPEGKNSNEE